MAKTESLQLKKRIIAFGMMLVMLFLSVFSVAAYSRTAVISDNGDKQEITTTEVYTDTILDTADVQLNSDDEVVRTDEDGVIKIKIFRAFEVTIENEGVPTTIKIARGTVGDALAKAKISYSSSDIITPDITEELKPGMKISINSNLPVTIFADGEEAEYIVPIGTVAQALIAARIDFTDDDIVSPNLNTKIENGMKITLKRVTFDESVKGVTIKFKETTKKTDSLYKGDEEIETYGVEGYKEIITTKKYVDGKLVDTTKTEEIIDEPVTQVVLVGTKAKATSSTSKINSASGNNFYKDGNGTFTDADGKTVKYKEKLVGSGTAYTANPGAITASGAPVYLGGVAVNPNIIPLGSKLYIVSNDGAYVYGYATAIDTGGALYAGDALVDVFYWSESECWNFGRRTVTVYVL